MTVPIIDAHQHFWSPDRGAQDRNAADTDDYPWLSGPFQPIRRAFTPEDLRPSLKAAGVDGSILVQTLNGADETRGFLRLAEATDFIAGVVGWVDLTDPAVGEAIAGLKAGPGGRWLVGIRHLLHEETDPSWILRPDVRPGLEAVAAAGLVYDLVGRTQHLPGMLQIVEAMPQLRFMLDHIAKPDIAAAVMEPWQTLMRGFSAHRDHVWCKLSGMITEADWTGWKPAHLQPYVAHALDVFGADRCLFGTDWPVCLLAGSYADVMSALRVALGDLPLTAQDRIFGGNAIESYGLFQFRS